MKTCVFCQTRLEDSAFRCICGRSLFIADEKHKTYPGPLRQKIMGMLRSSRKRYSEDEISTISFAIMEYCTAEHVGIDDYLISRIADNLDAQVEDEIKRNHDMLLREQQSRTQNTSLRNAPDSSHDSFERSSPFFRSDRSDEVGDNVFIETLADILNLSFIKDIVRFAYRHTGYDYKQYRDNASLWSDIQRGLVREGQRLKLSNFHVTEWIPYAPGRYFLPESVQARAQAQRFFSWSRREYLPLGKRDMIIGGIGSVRLKARVIDGQQYYFIGASSTGISHQGIPLIVNDSEYRSVADCLIANGGCCANINGRLKVMPPEISIIHYSKNIPKYFVHASRIGLLRPSPPDILLVTPSVLYSGSDYYYDDARSKYFELDGIKSEFRKGWAFCSFNPSDGVHAINAAAEWLNNYAKRYSETESDPILSDFDEHTQHFESPIEFPLKEILDSQINMRRLGIYGPGDRG